jgi:tetratricopeptide (TPR) repeat protein
VHETGKARERRRAEGFYDRFLCGRGLDIGCGPDKITAEAEGYDLEDGDAQYLEGLEDETYDFVYSSHCLEHTRDPLEALLNWWRVLKPGGHLLLAVPDEDLYEQGIVPSRFNSDHKLTFTISKEKSWSPVSRNLSDLLRHLPRHKVISIRTIDTGYDYEKLGSHTDQTLGRAEAAIECIVEKVRSELPLRTPLEKLARCPRCSRLELTLLGWHGTGELDVRCRGCGATLRMKASGKSDREEGDGARDGEKKPSVSREELEPLWQKALAIYTEKKIEGAQEICREILEKDPRHPDALHLLGAITLQSGDRKEGIRLLRDSVEADPARTVFRINLSQALLAEGDLAHALEELREAERRDRTNARVAYHLGEALLKKGEGAEASRTLHRSLGLQLTDAQAWLAYGKALLSEERTEEAALALRAAVLLDDNKAEAHFQLGNALNKLNDLDGAESAYREAVRLRPPAVPARHGLATILQRTGQVGEVREHLEAALAADPEHVPSILELAVLVSSQGDHQEGMALCRKALGIAPEDTQARFVLGLFHLVEGRYPEGWPLYESRLGEKNHREMRNLLLKACPKALVWEGDPLEGKTILVHHEQGIGDTIQSLRYLPLLEEAGARVLFQCPPALKALIRENFPSVAILGEEDPSDEPFFDFFVPTMSLPYRLGTTFATIPSARGYLKPDPEKVARYGERVFTEDENGLRVGIAWKGNPRHVMDRLRSVSLSSFSPLAGIEDVLLYSLQKEEEGSVELTLLDGGVLRDLGGTFRDFADTAAAIAHLDLVISIDSAVAHLAGALGKPTWVLLPHQADWRWLRDRADSPWYASVRLVRQEMLGDWDNVFRSVERDLRRAAERLAARAPDDRKPQLCTMEDNLP